MFVSDAGEEQFFEVLPIIFLVLAYPNNAILDDVGHNLFIIVRLSTLIVGEKGKCYMENEEKCGFSVISRKFLLFLQAKENKCL